jgi:hypothetical protein
MFYFVIDGRLQIFETLAEADIAPLG